MASNFMTACCLEKSLHEGDERGSFYDVAGISCYSTGEEYGNERVIVISTDVFGFKLKNILLIADKLAELGKSRVLIPDILNNEPVTQPFEKWFARHTPEITSPIFSGFLSRFRQEVSPKSLFGIGYCFGAKFVVQNLSEKGLLDAGAIAHPSLVSEEEVEGIMKPIIISAAQNDDSFPPELRHKTEEILSKRTTLKWELTSFSQVSHGYSVRGDISNLQVKYAKEKTLSDQIMFFSSL